MLCPLDRPDMHRTQAVPDGALDDLVGRFQACLQAAGTRRADDGRWRRVATYIRPLSMQLSLPDIILLLELERVRDAAQAAAARGDRGRAQRLLAGTRRIADAARWPLQAACLERSLWEELQSRLAADAGAIDDARQALDHAVEATTALAAQHAFPVQARLLLLLCQRVHLERLAGNAPQALRLALDLSAYADGDRARWPLHGIACPEGAMHLDLCERLACGEALLDELLATPADRDRLLALALKGDIDGLVSPWLVDWAGARNGLRDGDIAGFLAVAGRVVCSDALAMAPLRRLWRDSLRQVCRLQGRADLCTRLP